MFVGIVGLGVGVCVRWRLGRFVRILILERMLCSESYSGSVGCVCVVGILGVRRLLQWQGGGLNIIVVLWSRY